MIIKWFISIDGCITLKKMIIFSETCGRILNENIFIIYGILL